MPRDFHRSRRIEDQIQRILSDVIRTETRDPRLRGSIITSVDVSRDLGVAWVYFTSLNSECGPEELDEAFDSAMGFLRSQLAKSLTVRQVPELRFKHDDSLLKGEEMEQLIEKAVSSDKDRAGDDADSE